MKLPMTLDAGSSATGVVEILNAGEAPVHIVASVADWTSTRDGGMDFSPERVERSARAWVRPELDEFTLQPDGRRTVRIVASLPDSARGSYWAIVFFEGEAGEHPDGLGLAARVRIGTTVYLTARGTERRDDAITGMEVAPGPEPGTYMLKVSIANRGNVHYYPNGWFQVLDPQGEQISEETTPARVLLPGTETTYALPWRPSSAGERRLVATFDLGSETLLQGVKRFVVPESLLVRPAITMTNPQQAPSAGSPGR